MATEEMARQKKQGQRGGDVRVIGTATSAAAGHVSSRGRLGNGFSVLSAEQRRPDGAVQMLRKAVMAERLVFVEEPGTRAVAGEARDGGEDY